MRPRVWIPFGRLLAGCTSSCGGAKSLAASIHSDGSWSGISYTNNGVQDKHWANVVTMVPAAPRSRNAGAGISLYLRQWAQHDGGAAGDSCGVRLLVREDGNAILVLLDLRLCRFDGCRCRCCDVGGRGWCRAAHSFSNGNWWWNDIG